MKIWKLIKILTKDSQIGQDTMVSYNPHIYIYNVIANFSNATFVKIGANYQNPTHYNKRWPYRPSDFIGVWGN